MAVPMSMDAVTIPHGFMDLSLRLFLGAFLGSVVGFNRERHHKPAGLRTHALVALAAATFTVIGLFLTPEGSMHDIAGVSRIVQGLVAGVGFVGGGVIMRGSDITEVQGLTTAASILVVTALGAASGLGLWRTAIVTTALTMIILVFGGVLDDFIHRRDRAHPTEHHGPTE
jgi:putative Mg2+ transporter-C (MgtC) family protein